MRILHVVTAHTPENAFGGPMRVAVNQCTALRSLGHHAEIVSLSLGFAAPVPDAIDGVPAHLFRGRRFLPVGGFSSRSSPALLRWARRSLPTYDVVHAHLARDLVTLPVAGLAERAGVATVLQTHGMIEQSDRWSARALDSVATRRTLRGASALLYLTEHEQKALHEVANLDPTLLHRLPNGVPSQDPGAGPRDGKVILFLGRLHPRKRPYVVVGVAAWLREQGVHANVVIAGPDEGALDGTLSLIAERGLADRVTYVGGVDHLRALDLMRSASVFLLPSVDEPFPMSVLEAMSVGLPVVITSSNGLAADVRTTGAGRVTGPGVAALGAAVRDLLDPALNATAGHAGMATARTRFNMDGIVQELLRVYRDVTGDRPSSREVKSP